MGHDGIRIAHLIAVSPSDISASVGAEDGIGLKPAIRAGLCPLIC